MAYMSMSWESYTQGISVLVRIQSSHKIMVLSGIAYHGSAFISTVSFSRLHKAANTSAVDDVHVDLDDSGHVADLAIGSLSKLTPLVHAH